MKRSLASYVWLRFAIFSQNKVDILFAIFPASFDSFQTLILAFQPQSPGQANGHQPAPQQYVAANPISQAQTVAQTHTVTRIAQSPMKPQVNGKLLNRAHP